MVQNGVCSQNDDICGQNFKDEFESLDIRSIVLNFGVDANSDENRCIAIEDGEQRYESDISETVTFLETFGEVYFCCDVDQELTDACNLLNQQIQNMSRNE